MLEDRPPGTEIRVGFLLSVSDIYNWWKNRNKPKMEKLNDSYNSVSDINCLAEPSEIDKRIDDILAAGNERGDRDREEECCIGSYSGSCGK